ncbi:MAG: hypothetical protein Q3M24_02850 [Candidatus Electrothrix aestuarii]|uniref:Uncharacterized protein n=1 Tax=Candidatus Electrothrix aestuarii TaxID=3062594 RepID=A0AAU8LY01_9BACT|nr:hypothetical protein [Candidatus Electrothrix aestuarii]
MANEFLQIQLPEDEEESIYEISYSNVEKLVGSFEGIKEISESNIFNSKVNEDIWSLYNLRSDDLTDFFVKLGEFLDDIVSIISKKWSFLELAINDISRMSVLLKSKDVTNLHKILLVYSYLTELLHLFENFYQDPIKALKSYFIDLTGKYVTTPLKIGGVSFKITEYPDVSSPIIGPEASYSIQIDFGGYNIEFSELYFLLINNIPTPKFDRIEVKEVGLSNTLLSPLNKLFSGVTGDGFDLQLKSVFYRDEEIWLSIDVGVKLLDYFPKLIANDIEIGSSSGPKFDGELGLTDRNQILALGTTPFAFHGYEITVDISEQIISVETLVSFLAANSWRTIRLEVRIDAKFASLVIEMNGKLILLDTIGFADIEAYIDVKSIELYGKLTIPPEDGSNPLLEKILKCNGSFFLSSDGYFSDVDMSILGLIEKKATLKIGRNGESNFYSVESFDFLSVFSSKLIFNLSSSPGFKSASGSIAGHIEMNLIQIAGKEILKGSLEVAIDIDLPSLSRTPAIKVKASSSVLPASISFSIPSLDEDEIVRAIKNKLESMFSDTHQNILNLVIALDTGFREEVKEAENKFKKFIYEEAEKAGLDQISTGDSNIDNFLGDVSREGKNAAQALEDLENRIAGALSGIGNAVQDVWDTVFGGGIFGLRPTSNEEVRLLSEEEWNFRPFVDPFIKKIEQAKLHFKNVKRKNLSDIELEDIEIRFLYGTAGFLPSVGLEAGEIRFLTEVKSIRYVGGSVQKVETNLFPMSFRVIKVTGQDFYAYRYEESSRFSEFNLNINGLLNNFFFEMLSEQSNKIRGEFAVKRWDRIYFENTTDFEVKVKVTAVGVKVPDINEESETLERTFEKRIKSYTHVIPPKSRWATPEDHMIIKGAFLLSKLDDPNFVDSNYERKDWWVKHAKKEFGFQRMGSNDSKVYQIKSENFRRR